MKALIGRLPVLVFALCATCPAVVASGANYKHFDVAVYCRVYEVRMMKDPAYLENAWAAISTHVKVDKVYLETHRDTIVVDQATLDAAKAFFESKGVKVAGGITATINESNQFETYCYSNPEHRRKLQQVVEFTARNFDEIILDDFFFTSCKCDLCIRAKGNRSWTQFRLEQMDEAGRTLVMKPARAVNPNVKVTIKYPNWYDHFQNLGFNLETEPKYFDKIYTGTETRDPVYSNQHLQQYLGYSIFRYFENIKPGGNGGRMGGLGRAPPPRPLRRAALADALREGAGDHALRHPAAVPADQAGGREPGAGLGAGAPGRVRVPAGGWLHRQARDADRREDVQAVPLLGRRLPRELSRHDRDPDGYRPRLPGGRDDHPPDGGREGGSRDRGPDQAAAAGRQERRHHLGAAEGASGQGDRGHRRTGVHGPDRRHARVLRPRRERPFGDRHPDPRDPLRDERLLGSRERLDLPHPDDGHADSALGEVLEGRAVRADHPAGAGRPLQPARGGADGDPQRGVPRHVRPPRGAEPGEPVRLRQRHVHRGVVPREHGHGTHRDRPADQQAARSRHRAGAGRPAARRPMVFDTFVRPGAYSVFGASSRRGIAGETAMLRSVLVGLCVALSLRPGVLRTAAGARLGTPGDRAAGVPPVRESVRGGGVLGRAEGARLLEARLRLLGWRRRVPRPPRRHGPGAVELDERIEPARGRGAEREDGRVRGPGLDRGGEAAEREPARLPAAGRERATRCSTPTARRSSCWATPGSGRRRGACR